MSEKCKTCKHDSKPWHEEPCDSCCGAHSGYEADLISRQDAIDVLCSIPDLMGAEWQDETDETLDDDEKRNIVTEWISRVSPAQQEIIRCGDCKYYSEEVRLCNDLAGFGRYWNSEDFCSRAERRA